MSKLTHAEAIVNVKMVRENADNTKCMVYPDKECTWDCSWTEYCAGTYNNESIMVNLCEKISEAEELQELGCIHGSCAECQFWTEANGCGYNGEEE